MGDTEGRLGKIHRGLGDSVQGFSENTNRLILSGRVWGNVLALVIALYSIAALLRWGWVVSLIPLGRHGIPDHIAWVMVVTGVVLVLVMNREKKVTNQDWRVVGGLISGITMVAGIAFILSIADEGATIIGMLALSFGLMGLFFAMYGSGFRGMRSKHPVMFESLLLFMSYGLAASVAMELGSMFGIAAMGLIIMFSTLIITNSFTNTTALDMEHLRSAITIAVVSTYFGLLAFGEYIYPEEGSVLFLAVEHFWAILLIVVGYYFGSLALEKYVNYRSEKVPIDTR